MNNEIDKLLTEFKSIRNEFFETLAKFPKDKIENRLFGEWNIKDVIAHFAGWDNEFTSTLRDLISGNKHEYWGKIYLFNEKVVSTSQNSTWEEVLESFDDSGKEFISVYYKLPDNLVEIKIWRDKIYSPKRILQINIDHYENAQLKEIKKLIAKWQ